MEGKFLIIGLGLIGGSLAKAFHKVGYAIDAYDINNEYLENAKLDNIIINYYSEFEKIDFDAYDVLFICTPVKETLNFLSFFKNNKPRGIITDVGSTKREIVELALQYGLDNFIGGHPMAGTEKIGYFYSSENLFKNAYYFITPTAINKIDDINILKLILNKLEVRLEEIDYYIHDYIAGLISHLPHIASAALVNSINDDILLVKKFIGGGFKDTTRISSSSPKMWADISIANKNILADFINRYIDILVDIRNNIQDENYNNVYNFFDKAKTIRDKIVSDRDWK